MPKPHTFPILYDEALKINISKLKSWGYLAPGQVTSGTINWSINGNPSGGVSIKVNTHSIQPYLELDYTYQNKPRHYTVRITSTRSNLNRGEIWYFICPKTKKRCRKLYAIDGYFLHREAFPGCMYESQTIGKKYRQLWGHYGNDSPYSELLKKNFKKTYAGKPTKKYSRLMAQIIKAEGIPYDELDLERLI